MRRWSSRRPTSGLATAEFDAAFPYYVFLQNRYPETPNLERSIHSYLFKSAIDLFQKQRLSEAYSALDELYDQNSEFRESGSATVVSGLSAVTDKLIGSYVDKDDITSARRLLQQLVRKYGTKLPLDQPLGRRVGPPRRGPA